MKKIFLSLLLFAGVIGNAKAENPEKKELLLTIHPDYIWFDNNENGEIEDDEIEESYSKMSFYTFEYDDNGCVKKGLEINLKTKEQKFVANIKEDCKAFYPENKVFGICNEKRETLLIAKNDEEYGIIVMVGKPKIFVEK